MNSLFVILLVVGIGLETWLKGGDATLASLMGGAQGAVTLCLSLSGAYIFWMGFMGVLQKTGLLGKLSRGLRPVIRFLFPNAGAAQEEIAGNLAANMLGMGNAATPFGIAAMKKLNANNPHPGVATDEMCVLLAINSACLQIIPTGIIALRQAYGSVAPAAVTTPILFSSICSTLVTVALCRILTYKRRASQKR